MQISFTPSLGVTAISDVSLYQVPAKRVDYSIDDLQLVLYQTSASAPKGEIGYFSWRLQRDNKPTGTTHYERNFDLPGGTANVLFMTPSATSLVSALDGITSYRMTLDGTDTTSESVVPNTNLYQDRLLMTLANCGIRTHNMNQDVALLANPVPLVGNNQVLHLSQQQTPSVNPVVYLFRQVEQVC